MIPQYLKNLLGGFLCWCLLIFVLKPLVLCSSNLTPSEHITSTSLSKQSEVSRYLYLNILLLPSGKTLFCLITTRSKKLFHRIFLEIGLSKQLRCATSLGER